MDTREYLDIYRQMVLIRQLEEKAAELYQKGQIGGFLHLYIGQEAVSTGIVAARQDIDPIITAYRDHGVAVNVGIPTKQIIAELMGKASGISKGRGGSMHMADVTRNFWGGHAIVGAHIPIATGLALADKIEQSKGVTICMFGEGATNIGFFHEGINMAMVWKLPILWICENNQYGMGTPPVRASAVSKIIQKACGYGMPAYDVDGMDVMAVHDLVTERLEEIRNGSGPQFIEAYTYRFKGHSMGDPERYRSKEEVDRYVENGPIDRFRKFLMTEKDITKSTLDEIDLDVENEIQEAVAFAENSPDPADEELFRHIYVEE